MTDDTVFTTPPAPAVLPAEEQPKGKKRTSVTVSRDLHAQACAMGPSFSGVVELALAAYLSGDKDSE